MYCGALIIITFLSYVYTQYIESIEPLFLLSKYTVVHVPWIAYMHQYKFQKYCKLSPVQENSLHTAHTSG